MKKNQINLHKKTKGDIAEIRVAADLLKKGYRILFPYGENGRYDVVAEKGGIFIRFQVKYVTPKNNTLDVNCRSSNNWNVINYSKDDFDYIAAFDSVNENIYYINSTQMNRNSFKIRLKATKNNQKIGINYFDKFLKINPGVAERLMRRSVKPF